MQLNTFHLPKLVVSPSAVEKLQQIKSQTGYSVVISLDRSKQGQLIMDICHEVDANGFQIEINGMLLAMTPGLLQGYSAIDVGFIPDGAGQGSFVLLENDELVVSLSFDQVIAHVLKGGNDASEDDYGGYFASRMMG